MLSKMQEDNRDEEEEEEEEEGNDHQPIGCSWGDVRDSLDLLDTSKWPPNVKLLSCDICDQKFSNKLKIVIHWSTAHHYKLCGFCINYAFKYDSDKIQHERQHIPFGCSLCSHEFNKICEESISEHYKVFHQSFLCTYCSSIIQPYSKYPEHVEKKHNLSNFNSFISKNSIYKFFEIVETKEDEEAAEQFFFCFMCDKKKRLNLLFGHYVFYHNISIHSLKKALDLTYPDFSINGSNLSKSATLTSHTEGENSERKLKESCSVCEIPFRFEEEEVGKELHGVFCKGNVVCSLKDCNRIFQSMNELKSHLEVDHPSLSCKFGCAGSELKPVEIDNHLESFHDLIECFLCNIVNSSATFKNHLRDKHSVNLSTYEKALAKATSKLYHVEYVEEDNERKQVLCNFCDRDITEEIKAFSFIDHYKNQHEINMMAILRNLDKNPIIDTITGANNNNNNDDVKSDGDEECLSNFFTIKSYDSLIETDFDATKVYCIGIEHIEEKPKINSPTDDEDMEGDEEYKNNYGMRRQQLTCEFCQTQYNRACELYEHLKKSHGFRLLNVNKCEKCKIETIETFTSVDNKNFNLALVCPYDKTNHVTKDNFTDHLILEHSEKALPNDIIIYKCHVCNYTYKSMKEIRKHFNDDHPNIKMKYCRICRIKLNSNEDDHFSLNHAEDLKRTERFCCKICKKEFKKEGAAKVHFMRVHKTKDSKKKSLFKCQNKECKESFSNKEDRKMHQLFAHPNEKMYQCKACPLKFSTKSSLSSHNVIHKNVINTCEYCSKTFLRRDSFKEHLLIHSDLRLKCSFCEKVFVQRSNLIRHERIHLNDKPYKCTFCEKTFSDKGACTSHEKVHTKTEHADCEICGKHFARKQKLKYHMRLHTLENVLTCEACGKIFPESYSYKKHLETHQNKTESTRCHHCNKTFKSKKSRDRHEQSAHIDQNAEEDELILTRIQCTICNMDDFSPQTIKDHLLNVHNVHSSSNWQNFINEVEFQMNASPTNATQQVINKSIL